MHKFLNRYKIREFGILALIISILIPILPLSILLNIPKVSAGLYIKKIEIVSDPKTIYGEVLAKVYVDTDTPFKLIGYVIKNPYNQLLYDKKNSDSKKSYIIKLDWDKWDWDSKGKTKSFQKNFTIDFSRVIDITSLTATPAGNYQIIFLFVEKIGNARERKINYTVDINIRIQINLKIYVVEKIIDKSFIINSGPIPKNITGKLTIKCGGKTHFPNKDEISTFKGATWDVIFLIDKSKYYEFKDNWCTYNEMKTDGSFTIEWGYLKTKRSYNIGNIMAEIRDSSKDFNIIKVEPDPSKPIIRDKNLKIFKITVSYNLPKNLPGYEKGVLEFNIYSPKFDPWELSGVVTDSVKVEGSGKVTRKLTCWIEPGEYKYNVLYIVVTLFRINAPAYDVRINKYIVYKVIDQKESPLKVVATTPANKLSPGEKPLINIKVTYKGKPVKGAGVWLVVHKPDGKTVRSPSKGIYCCTNEKGEMTIKVFKIPSDIEKGKKFKIEIIASYQPRRGNELLRPVYATTELQLSSTTSYMITFLEQLFENNRLIFKPMKVNISVTGATKLKLKTDKNGKISLLNIIRNNKGEIIDGSYTIRLVDLPKGNDEWKKKWGTLNKYPMWSNKAPPGFQVIVTSDLNKPLGHSIYIRYIESFFIKDKKGELIQLESKGSEIKGDIVLVLRNLYTWEQIIKYEIENFLKAAGVDPAVARKIAKIDIVYGANCGMCGSQPCPGMFDPKTGKLYIHLTGDKEYSTRGLSVSYDALGNLLHEFGHRVKEILLYDPGAKLGGEHTSEYEPCSNPQLAYDEAFADLFPILVQSYSKLLPSYVGLSYDNPKKVYGKHSSGKSGEYFEGRIAGFWVAFYKLPYHSKSGKSVYVLKDIIYTSRVYKSLVGRPPRTIIEWITIKAFLYPSKIKDIMNLVKPSKYNIPAIFIPGRLGEGILRTQKIDGISAFIHAQSMHAKLSPPSRISVSKPGDINLKKRSESTLCLVARDMFYATGWKYDGTIFLKLANDHSIQNMLKIDLYGQELTNMPRGMISVSDDGNLIIVNPCKVHIKKIGNGIPGLKIFTPFAEITSIHSEFLIEIFKNKTTSITVMEGSIVLSSNGINITVNTGEKTSIQKGKSPSKPVKVDISKIDKWWPVYTEQKKTNENKTTNIWHILNSIINAVKNFLENLFKTVERFFGS